MIIRSFMRLFLILIAAVYINCASRGVPGGGPVDRTPPEVTGTDPQADSTGIADLQEIIIRFSERMDEATAANAVFISPPLAYATEWSGGDELTLHLSDTLKPDVTYVVTIGSGASDSRKNRMTSSYQFAFSTGRTIQRGQIDGLVYGISEKDPFYVYAYYQPDSVSPETDPTRQPADFLTQPGSDGFFSLRYLKAGAYRIYIVEDQNGNFILDSDYERVGIPSRDVILDSAGSRSDDLYFKVTRIDTIPPQVTGARALHNGKVLVRLSEPVDRLRPDMLDIQDTTANSSLMIRSVIPNNEEKNQYFIFTNRQAAGNGYRLRVGQLCDTTGNCQDASQFAVFTGSADTDTVTFRILKITPRDSSKNVPIERPVGFQMSGAVDAVSFASAFTIQTEAGDTLEAVWQWENLENGYLGSDAGIRPGTAYRFMLQSEQVRSVRGDTLTDSTITRVFSTRSADEFGSLSGIIDMPPALASRTYLFIQPLSGRKKVDFFAPAPDHSFRVDWLPEGQYILGGYIDFDLNHRYSPGTIYPFEYAEPFYIQPDTIRIRKRWEVSDFRFSIPAQGGR